MTTTLPSTRGRGYIGSCLSNDKEISFIFSQSRYAKEVKENGKKG